MPFEIKISVVKQLEAHICILFYNVSLMVIYFSNVNIFVSVELVVSVGKNL